jgi:hypothetical protein
MAPPIGIPAMGTTAIGFHGTTPEASASTSASTGAAPAPIAAEIHSTPRGVPTYRADVSTAMTNISATKAPVSQPVRRIALIARETTVSWARTRSKHPSPW